MWMKGQRRLLCIKGQTSSDFIIRFTGRAEMTWQGQVVHVQSGHKKYFRSYMELWHLLQQKLDKVGRPRKTMRIRSWGDRVGEKRCGEQRYREGKM